MGENWQPRGKTHRRSSTMRTSGCAQNVENVEILDDGDSPSFFIRNRKVLHLGFDINSSDRVTGELSAYGAHVLAQDCPAPLDTTDLCPLISSILHTAADLIALPQDMTLPNFQQDVGGTVEGLIGIKHIQEFPVPVFHLQNGLSIFCHNGTRRGLS